MLKGGIIVASIVKSLGISGVEGYLVDVETKIIQGLPMISIVGLGDTAIKEAKERITAAIYDGGYTFPQMKVVINLAPSDLKKSGSHYDLPMALGILMETEQLKLQRKEVYSYIGELSLNARLRACTGILPMVIAAKKAGITHVIVPKKNVKEALLVQGMHIYGFDTLREVVDFLEGKADYNMSLEELSEPPGENSIMLDFKDVHGQQAAIEYVVVAASGGHNLLMLGPPRLWKINDCKENSYYSS